MFRKALVIMVMAFLFVVYDVQGDQPEPITSTWVGGAAGDWENATNWNPAIVPNNNESQTFAVTISDAEVGLEHSHVIDQLDCYGNVVFCGGVSPPEWWAGLSLEGANGLRNHGYLRTESQIMLHIHHGNLDNPEGCTIDTAINVGIAVEGNLENAGLIMIPPTSSLWSGQLHNTGQIIVYGGVCSIGEEIWDNDSTGIIRGFGTLAFGTRGVRTLVNKGKIYTTGGGLTVATNGLSSNTGTIGNTTLTSLNLMHVGIPSDMSNFGTIEVNAGGGVVFDCNLVNEPNGVIKLLGGTLAATTITQKADANFAGFGGISGNVIIDNNGLIKLTGPTNVVGDVEIKNNATLQISDGLTLITGKTTCNGTIHIKGGYVIPQGGLSGNCNIIWEPGLYTNVADFNLDGQVNLKDFAYFADTWLWQTAWY